MFERTYVEVAGFPKPTAHSQQSFSIIKINFCKFFWELIFLRYAFDYF